MKYGDAPDCGDHSCKWAENKSGMRTNGGCRCLTNNPKAVEFYARRKILLLQDEIDLCNRAHRGSVRDLMAGLEASRYFRKKLQEENEMLRRQLKEADRKIEMLLDSDKSAQLARAQARIWELENPTEE